jgi:hypothetical protein
LCCRRRFATLAVIPTYLLPSRKLLRTYTRIVESLNRPLLPARPNEIVPPIRSFGRVPTELPVRIFPKLAEFETTLTLLENSESDMFLSDPNVDATHHTAFSAGGGFSISQSLSGQ